VQQKAERFRGLMANTIRPVLYSTGSTRLPYSNTRYRHYDLGAKVLLVESRWSYRY